MSIEFRVALGDNKSLLDDVKKARGTACYGALAAHFGTDSPTLLEWRIDRRKRYRHGDDLADPSNSNKYLRWRQGKALPHPDSIEHVRDQSGQSVRLDYWKDLPLWDLLDPNAPPISHLNRLLEQMPMNIRRHLFFDGEPDSWGRFHHSWPERDQILAIRNRSSIEALIALLCLARKAEVMEDHPQHFFASTCAFDLLPRVLYGNPALRYRWEGLVVCIERIFWNRVYTSGFHGIFLIETIRDGLTKLDADPNATLPLQSGKRSRTGQTNTVFSALSFEFDPPIEQLDLDE